MSLNYRGRSLLGAGVASVSLLAFAAGCGSSGSGFQDGQPPTTTGTPTTTVPPANGTVPSPTIDASGNPIPPTNPGGPTAGPTDPNAPPVTATGPVPPTTAPTAVIIDPITGMPVVVDVNDPNVVIGRNGCTVTPGLISDFEDEALSPLVVETEGRGGTWEAFAGGITPTVTVEPSGGTAACDLSAYHVTGQGAADFVGVGLTFRNPAGGAAAYNATAATYNAIRFRARTGPGHSANSPVRFNVVTPTTELVANEGACVIGAGAPCQIHQGRFLDRQFALTSTWQEYTFCFDRDLYPLFLPNPLTTAAREAVGSEVLKLQWQFNNAKNLAGIAANSTATAPEFDKALPFDFFLDDVEFVSDAAACPAPAPVFAASSPAVPFGQNSQLGSCQPPTGVARFNATLIGLYNQWRALFVRDEGGSSRVVTPEQGSGNFTSSEGMGYGMMIAAAVGDRATFDAFRAYVAPRLVESGLMTWNNEGGTGSASDGDIDVAYALMMADLQWPDGTYGTAGSNGGANAPDMVNAIFANDRVDGHLSAGSNFDTVNRDAFNPSYFAPRFFRAFASINTGFNAGITTDYGIMSACQNGFGATGLVPDWCLVSGTAVSGQSIPVQVTSTVSLNSNTPVYAFDAARTPWRIGADACHPTAGATARTFLTPMINHFTNGIPQSQGGARIDSLVAGFVGSGAPGDGSTPQNQASFIGPVGVGAQGLGDQVTLDRAFRAVLDILENPEFNRTYFPATVGLITLLHMSGNFPYVN